MRRIAGLLLLLLLLAPLPLSAQVVTLPKEVTGAPSTFVRVPATADGSVVRWVILDTGMDLFPPELLKDSKTAVVTAPVAGRYRILAYTAKGDVASPPAICTVVIGDPGPGPGPTPPAPTDPLYLSMKAAWDKEPAADKQHIAHLAAVYRVSANKGQVNGAYDPAIKTMGDLLKAVHTGIKSFMPDTALPNIRKKAIEDAAATALPTSPRAVLDDATRTRCADFFTKLAAALEALPK